MPTIQEDLMPKTLEFGVIGLGRMGGGLAHLALERGMRVVGFAQSKATAELIDAGLVEIDDLLAFKRALAPPRVVLLYIPAGPDVDSVLHQLSDILDRDDIVVDGGNSYWGDSIDRHRRLGEKGLRFVDLGTSGGVEGARNGPCFMAGGDRATVAEIEPILLGLAVDGGYVHAGPPGSGHFVKLVHNGIEFGMLEAIGEGIDLLDHFHERLDISEILRCWRHGSVIRSWLVDLLHEAYRADPGMEGVSSYIEDTGEVNWLIQDAVRMELPVPAIAQSVMQLFASRDERQGWARAIIMMRRGFGGHPPGPDASVARERREGRVGEIFRPDR
jgi:6-phosphogluconate dehydrogenase